MKDLYWMRMSQKKFDSKELNVAVRASACEPKKAEIQKMIPVVNKQIVQ